LTAEEFAAFWGVQGHRIIRTASCFWYNAGPLSFLGIPYHRDVSPSAGELMELFLRGPAAVVRFSGKAAPPNGGLFVCSDRGYSLASLEKKARNQTRRGLENSQINQVDFTYLASAGHSINQETFVRQGRHPETIPEHRWVRYCNAASRTPDFEAWGAFIGDHLAAFMVTALVEDCFSILHQASRTSSLSCYPNNALTFHVTSRKLSCPGIAYVSYGLKSVEDTSSLDHYKLQMGFEIRPRSDHVVLHPLLRPVLYCGGRRFIGWMAGRHPESDFWRKASSTLLHKPAAGDDPGTRQQQPRR
jgi:hypothetical protein